MRLSSRSVNAISFFIDLGEHYGEGYISLVDIARRKELSKKYLEQVVILYKNSGLIIGNRGNQGGYKLSKEPKEISLKDILMISETTLIKEKSDINVIDKIIDGIDNSLDDYLSRVTLDMMVEYQKSSYSNNYVI